MTLMKRIVFGMYRGTVRGKEETNGQDATTRNCLIQQHERQRTTGVYLWDGCVKKRRNVSEVGSRCIVYYLDGRIGGQLFVI